MLDSPLLLYAFISPSEPSNTDYGRWPAAHVIIFVAESKSRSRSDQLR